MAKEFALVAPRRGVLAVSGPDRVDFLQGLVSNDVRRVGPGRGIWAALLTPQGKYLHDFFITAQGDAWLLDCAADRVTDLRRRLGMFRLRAKVEIADVTDAHEVWQVWGDDAAPSFGLSEPGAALAYRGGTALLDPRLAALGVRVVLPAGDNGFESRGFSPGDFATWDRLRITLGVPDGARDMVIDKAILLENGFDALNGVSFDKGCYLGQELTARTKYRGLVKKRLIPVQVEGDLPPAGTIITGSGGAEAGEMRSGQAGLALALLRLDSLTSSDELIAGDTRLTPMPPAWMGLPIANPVPSI